MANLKYMLLVTSFLSVFAQASDTSIETENAEYCDFRLYLPSEKKGASDTLLLERSDISTLRTTIDENDNNNGLQWQIEVADHALSRWKTASKKHIGLPMRIYCGDELIASPVVRAPLGKQFKVMGMKEDARRIR